MLPCNKLLIKNAAWWLDRNISNPKTVRYPNYPPFEGNQCNSTGRNVRQDNPIILSYLGAHVQLSKDKSSVNPSRYFVSRAGKVQVVPFSESLILSIPPQTQ